MTPDKRISLFDDTLLPSDRIWKSNTHYIEAVRSGNIAPCELPGSTPNGQFRELQTFLNDEVGAHLPSALVSGYGLDRLQWVAYPDLSHTNMLFAAMSTLTDPREGIEQAQATLELCYSINRTVELRTQLAMVRFAAVNHAGIVCSEYGVTNSDPAQAPSLESVDFSSHRAERDTLTMLNPYSARRPYYTAGLTTNTMLAVNASPLFHFFAADRILTTLQRELTEASDLFTASVSGDSLRIQLHGAASQIQYVIPMHLVSAAKN